MMRVIWVTLLVFPALLGIVVAIHYPGMHAAMIYDSIGFIEEYQYVFASGDVPAVLGIVPARPVLMLTVYANYLASGMEPFPFRVLNAGFLAGAGIALAFLTMLILELPGVNIPGSRLEKRLMAAFIGMVFLVHPLQKLTVLYIWQREAVMGCFFFFAALAVYVAGRSGRVMSEMPAYAVTGLLFFAGMMSKENVITLPVVLLLAEIVLLRETAARGTEERTSHDRVDSARRSWPGLRETAKRAAIIAAIVGLPLLISQMLVHVLHGPDATHPQGLFNRLLQYYRTAGLTPSEVVMTQCRMVFWYLYTIVAPWWSGVVLIEPSVVSRSLVNPPITVAAVAGVVALVAMGLALMRKHPLPSFGIFFFLITLTPESLLIPQYLFCGYRAILPMAGVLFVLTAWVLHFVCSRGRVSKIATAAFLGGLIVGLAAMTFVQARQWTPLLVWKDAYERLPRFSSQVEVTPYLDILGSYGHELKKTRQYDQAVDVLDRLIAIDSPPNSFKRTAALVYKGLALLEHGDKAQGIAALKEAHHADPRDYWACFQLAQALIDNGTKDEGRELLKKALAANPRYLPARLRLAHLLRESGQLQDAIALYQEAAGENPHSGAIQNALGAALEASGNVPQALDSYRKAVQCEPRSAAYYFNLAKLLGKTGLFDDAIANYQKAVQLNERFGPAQANLGTLLLRSGRASEAIVHFQKALAVIPRRPELHVQAAIALMSLGRNEEAKDLLEKALAIDPHYERAGQELDRLTTDEDAQDRK